jgi:hypothetical protein
MWGHERIGAAPLPDKLLGMEEPIGRFVHHDDTVVMGGPAPYLFLASPSRILVPRPRGITGDLRLQTADR